MSSPPHLRETHDDLEPPPSFQRASWDVGSKRKASSCSRNNVAHNGDAFWNAGHASKDGQLIGDAAGCRLGITIASSNCSMSAAAHASASSHSQSRPRPPSAFMSSRPPTSSSSSSSSRLSAADIAVTAVTAATKAPGPRSFFDPWNSSSTGHQRAENRLSGSTSWRESRNLKLGEQYRSGLGGGQRLADTVGAGSKDFGKDGRQQNGRWVKGAKGLRAAGQKSLAEVWGKRKAGAGRRDVHVHVGEKLGDVVVVDEQPVVEELDDSRDESPSVSNSEPPQKQIFEGLCFYLNGSTAPLVSDHKLKHIIAERGGRMSTALGRRSVTHVILGSANGQHGGAGGGLAASKIQKEISRVGGKGVKFVGVEWVLECIKADRRLPESRYSTLKLAPKAQNSVFPMLHAKEQQGGAQG